MIERGIKFDKIHSYQDLNLILSAVEIVPAEPKTTYVDVPCADGSVDLTEAHGEVKFNDRDGCKFTFTMNPQDELTDEAFELKKSEVCAALNGVAFEKITLDKDSDYYYTGRCAVDQFLSDRRLRQFVVVARLKPYKMRHFETVRKIRFEGKGTQNISLVNGRKPVVPFITCSDDGVLLTLDGIRYSLSQGTTFDSRIRLKAGANQLTITGTGTVEIRFREGDL